MADATVTIHLPEATKAAIETRTRELIDERLGEGEWVTQYGLVNATTGEFAPFRTRIEAEVIGRQTGRPAMQRRVWYGPVTAGDCSFRDADGQRCEGAAGHSGAHLTRTRDVALGEPT